MSGILGALYVRRLLPYDVHLKTINVLNHATRATDVQAEGHMPHRDSYIVFLFDLLFLSLNVHFFLPFHIPSYFISLTTSSQRTLLPFFCHALFFSCFPSSFGFYLLILFHSFARSPVTNYPPFRGKSFFSSPKRSIPARLST